MVLAILDTSIYPVVSKAFGTGAFGPTHPPEENIKWQGSSAR